MIENPAVTKQIEADVKIRKTPYRRRPGCCHTSGPVNENHLTASVTNITQITTSTIIERALIERMRVTLSSGRTASSMARNPNGTNG
jgi:hypothetical protein